eukprot:497198_1
MTDQINNHKGFQKESKSDQLIVIRISGRKGFNAEKINGDYFQQNKQHKNMPYFKKTNSDDMLYWCTISQKWDVSDDFQTYRMRGQKLQAIEKTENDAKANKCDPEDVSEWKVWEGEKKGDVTDKNIKVEKLFISKSLYENTECVLTG